MDSDGPRRALSAAWQPAILHHLSARRGFTSPAANSEKEAGMISSMFRIRAVLAVIILGLAVSGCGYNNIPTLEESAKAKWADVQNNYQRRADLIPNLVATAQGYAKQERDVLTAVVEARAKATQVRVDVSQLTDPEKLNPTFSTHGKKRMISMGAY